MANLIWWQRNGMAVILSLSETRWTCVFLFFIDHFKILIKFFWVNKLSNFHLNFNFYASIKKMWRRRIGVNKIKVENCWLPKPSCISSEYFNFSTTKKINLKKTDCHTFFYMKFRVFWHQNQPDRKYRPIFENRENGV